MNMQNDGENIFEAMGLKPGGLSDKEHEDISNAIPKLTDSTQVTKDSLKLMDGKYGGGFYVRYLQDDVKKYGWLNLIIVYPDKSYKSILLFKNVFRQTDTETNGVYISDNTKVKKGHYREMFSDHSDWKLMLQYETPNMPIPSPVIWKLITENYVRIPIIKLHQTAPLEHIYLELWHRAAEYAKNPALQFMDTADRFFVPKSDFEQVSKENGWQVNDVKTELDVLGILIRDKAPGSYQYSKRIQGELVRFYVLRKNLPELPAKQLELENTAFKDDYKTTHEETIARLEKHVDELKTEIFNSHQGERPADVSVTL